MIDNILLDDEEYHFSENELPCLIIYKEKSGGSHLTITLIADLFLRGSKILFLTAYPMAKDNFLQQIKNKENQITYIKKEKDLINAERSQAIILKSGEEKLYLNAIKKISDIHERIILIKNIEIFSDKLINQSLKMKKIILSGDIDACHNKKQISNKTYKTIIAFSQPKTKLPISIPQLKKYQGHLSNNNKKGLIYAE